MARKWTEHELLIAMNLYCLLPFGQFDQRNKLIQLVAPKIDRSAGALAMKLSNLASLDPYHQNRGVKGLPSTSKLDKKVWADFQANWTLMAEKSETAFQALMRGADLPKEYGIESTLPEGPTETERIVKARRVQGFFRRTVLASYNKKCALTGMSDTRFLIASHIIPWKDDEQRRADPTNGLCLNVLHDKAFDQHLITFDEDLRMVVSGILKSGDIPEFQAVNFPALEGTQLSMPERFSPDPAALKIHRAEFGKMQ